MKTFVADGRRSLRLEAARTWRWSAKAAILSALMPFVMSASHAKAQSGTEFYKGKTLRIIVATAPGAAYDFVARALAASLGRHIPGAPGVTVENMPGAGSLVMMNTLYNKQPRDGTVMGLPINGIVLEPRLKMLTREGGVASFDLSKMAFIGSPTQQPQILWVWHGSSFNNAADLKTRKAIMGSTSFGADNYILPKLSNEFLGTTLEVVPGYNAVNDIFMAGERGEVDGGTANYSSLAGKSDWVADHKARVLLQFGTERIADLSDVPTAVELAPDEEARAALRAYALKFKSAYPFVLPPGVPGGRVEILRKAFMETMKDPQFVADAQRLGFDVEPVSGEEIAGFISQLDSVPQTVVDRLRKALN
ncbi:MAG: Tripartite-type tricarboxylate transporter, receptor component TctC [Hyphomicrobiales bacterium]|nr:Tripartite-type tricarboxylate transporter, receptor component TctC [Hyphomicrobiales bacterium]